MSSIANPQLKNMSGGVGGILGSSGSASPYFSNANGSLPDLKQSKREALEAELLQPQANTASKRGVGGGGRRF